jgi:UPF0716 protein FxsA
MPILFLLFVLVPVIEIALFIQVGGFLGLVPTLIIVIGTAALGTWLLRQQGLSTLARARSRLDSGELPATQLIEGAILLVGGALLLTPGFMTDAVGFACLVPPSRRWLAAQLASRFQMVAMHGAAGGESQMGGFPGRGQSGPVPRPRAPGVKAEGEVIEGEWQQVDKEP